MWSQRAYLKPSYAAFNSYWFGFSVAASDTTVVVGARLESSNATGVDGDPANNLAAFSGAAYVFGANVTPTISPTDASVAENSPAATLNIASVDDAEDDEDDLVVTVDGGASATANGVTVSNIQVSASGAVTADVTAACGASTATFTLRVTDSGGLFAEDTLTITVTPGSQSPSVVASAATAVLWPINHLLVNVGLTATAVDECSGVPTVQVVVFSNQDDEVQSPHSPDAKNPALNALRLRAERAGDSGGRVYLIVVKAIDASGNIGFDVTTVVIPQEDDAGPLAAVQAAAAAAQAFALANGGTPPAGYVLVGDGPILGPKQ